MSTIQNHETDEIPQGFEGYVATIEFTNKPWYLTSTVVYETIKKIVAVIPHSKALFDKSINGIVALTNFINMKTGSNIVVIDHEKANELIDQLDDILSKNFIRIDDGFDNLRSKLAKSIHRLIDSLVEQKKLAVATRNVLVATVENARDVTTQSLTALLEKVKTRGLDIYHSADSQFSWATEYILKTAQPYVRTAVYEIEPFYDNAVELSDHCFDPLVERVYGVKKALEELKVVGPYVARAFATANKMLADVKAYCLSERDEEVQEGVHEVFGVMKVLHQEAEE